MGNHDLSNSNSIEIENSNNNDNDIKNKTNETNEIGNDSGNDSGNDNVKSDNEKKQTIKIIENSGNIIDEINEEKKEEKKEEEEEEELENEDKPKINQVNIVQRSNSEKITQNNTQMSKEQKEEAEKANFLSYLPPNYLKEMLKTEDELKEELIQQTIDSSPIYDTKEALLNSNDTSSLLFWGKKISSFTKRRKNFLFQILRIYFSKSDAHFNLLQRQIILSLLPFHYYSIESLENCSKQIESSFLLDKFDVFDIPMKKNRFPTIVFELNYEWAISSLRLAKHLYLLGEMEKAHYHCDRTLKLFFRIFLNERKKKTFTQLVFYKLIKAFELITFVKGKESKVIEYVDLFLMQFSNMVMKEKAVQLSIKPLLEMNYSDSRHLSDANSIEVLRYFAKFFGDTKLGKDSAEALTELDNLPLMLRKETRLKELIDVKGRRMMRESGLKRREYCFRPDIIWNLLIRRYEPKFAISISSLPKFHIPSVREEKERGYGEVEGLPMSGVDVTIFGTTLNLETKKRHFVKVFKTVDKFPVKVAYEMSLLLHLSSLSSFIKVHSYFLFDRDLWCIFEGETEGYFIHELVVYPSIFKEGEIALISKKILEGLRDLHSHKLSLRDMTSRNVFITREGEVMIIPNFFYENYQSRFYTPPENLIPSAKFLPFPADIWSFASILYEICENSPPYATYHPLKEYFYISANGLPEIKRSYSNELQVFYSLASDVNPANRSSAADLLEHEFIKQSELSSSSDLANVIQSLL